MRNINGMDVFDLDETVEDKNNVVQKKKTTFESCMFPLHIDSVLPILAFSILTKNYVYNSILQLELESSIILVKKDARAELCQTQTTQLGKIRLTINQILHSLFLILVNSPMLH
jgi:hypothetical protein